jgi:hypothetical protein
VLSLVCFFGNEQAADFEPGGASWCWVCTLPIDDLGHDCDYESEVDEQEEEEDIEDEPWDNMLEEGVELPQLFNEEYIRASPLELTTTPMPQQRLRRRGSNLDGMPADYWVNRGLNFGHEPVSNLADHVWCCSHNFKPLVPQQSQEVENAKDEERRESFACHRCWDMCNQESVQECQRCWLMYCLPCVERSKPAPT